VRAPRGAGNRRQMTVPEPTVPFFGKVVHHAGDIVSVLAPVMENLEVEEFHILLLDARHRVRHHEMVARGSLTGVEVHPREVFCTAVRQRAAMLVVSHNHPSGDPSPSPADIAITERLLAAGRLLGIPVCDHVIIAKGSHFSFFDRGLIGFARAEPADADLPGVG